MRGKNHFKATDLLRAIRTVTRAGLTIGRVEIDQGGRIVIATKEGDQPPANGNEWDEIRGTDAA